MTPPTDPGSDPAPPEILELSESCRQFVLSAVGVELDYEPETLPLLDHYLVEARGGVNDRPEVLELLLRSCGAYFGEVSRRSLDGFWIRTGSDVHRWRVGLRRVVLSFNPAGIVREVLARDSELPGPEAALAMDRSDEALVARKLSDLPPVSDDEFHRTATRLEALEIAQATLLERMQQDGGDPLELSPEDYEDDA